MAFAPTPNRPPVNLFLVVSSKFVDAMNSPKATSGTNPFPLLWGAGSIPGPSFHTLNSPVDLLIVTRISLISSTSTCLSTAFTIISSKVFKTPALYFISRCLATSFIPVVPFRSAERLLTVPFSWSSSMFVISSFSGAIITSYAGLITVDISPIHISGRRRTLSRVLRTSSSPAWVTFHV